MYMCAMTRPSQFFAHNVKKHSIKATYCFYKVHVGHVDYA